MTEPAAPEQYKARAAEAAVAAEVRDGMVVGLGTGSTAAYAIEEIGRRMHAGRWRIRGIPTSEQAAALARGRGIPLTTLDAVPDVVIDGADQIDPALNLVKGGGGAHVREKLVALAARRVVVVADHTKMAPRLRGPIPLEVLAFALPWVLRALPARLPGSSPAVRMRDGRPFASDGGNLIVDLACGVLDDPGAVAAALDRISGVVDHGLFIGLAHIAYVAGPEGVHQFAKPG